MLCRFSSAPHFCIILDSFSEVRGLISLARFRHYRADPGNGPLA